MIAAARPRWLRYRRGHSANAREAANGAKKESQRQDQGKAQEDLAHRGDYPQKNQGFRRSMSASTVIRDRFTFAMVGSGAKTFRRTLQGASTHMKSKYVQLACMLVLASGALAIKSVPLLATSAEYASLSARNLYAVNQSSKNRGSISIYDIDARSNRGRRFGQLHQCRGRQYRRHC